MSTRPNKEFELRDEEYPDDMLYCDNIYSAIWSALHHTYAA